MMAESAANPSYIESLLKECGFEKIRRKNGGRPGFIACCRFHDERNPSFSISDSGLWMCWTCGEKGNLRKLIEKLGNGTMDWRRELKIAGLQLSRFEAEPRKRVRTANLPKDFTEYTFEAEVPPQIAKRLKWETIRIFKLGYSSSWPNAGRCIVPVFHKEKCVGYHGRALRPDMDPRYYNPDGFEIKEYIFNYDGCKPGREVIVVEGAFNAMSMVEKGFANTVSTFGTKVTGAQLRKIISLKPSSVTLCFDRDKSKVVNGVERGHSGQKAAVEVGAMLDEMVKVEVMPLPFDKDPNDLPADVLAECHKRRVPYNRVAGGRA